MPPRTSPDGRDRQAAKAGPYGLSEIGQQFMAGMMKLSRELAVFVAPFINSYKRYASLSWAPVNVVWGRDNRTTGFRLVGHGPALHVENRFPGGDMNAYLTYAAMIGAGLYGIEHKLKLGARVQGQRLPREGRPRMPRALYEAIWELERSEAAVEIFGQDVVDHYLNAARVEQETYDSIVHPWDASATSSAASVGPASASGVQPAQPGAMSAWPFASAVSAGVSPCSRAAHADRPQPRQEQLDQLVVAVLGRLVQRGVLPVAWRSRRPRRRPGGRQTSWWRPPRRPVQRLDAE